MKFAAVILLACVAVSSAAFTGSLVQQMQPAVGKAMFQIRLVAGNKAVVIPAVQNILDHIQSAVNGLIQQAQEAIAHGQQVSAQLQQHLVQAAQSLQNVGGQAAQSLQTIIQNLLNGIQTSVGGRAGLDLAGVIAAAQAQLQSYVALAQQLIAQIDLPSLAIQAIHAAFPQNIAQVVIAQLGLSNERGLWGDLFGNLWGQISETGSQALAAVTAVIQQITQVGQSAFADVQAQASQFLQNVAAGASHLSGQAAQQILEHIGDLQEALGNQYQDVVDALNGIVINGN
jgi:F0F1-type ATP synthase membrane subunit b/b'